jgi:hypothetical protein
MTAIEKVILVTSEDSYVEYFKQYFPSWDITRVDTITDMWHGLSDETVPDDAEIVIFNEYFYNNETYGDLEQAIETLYAHATVFVISYDQQVADTINASVVRRYGTGREFYFIRASSDDPIKDMLEGRKSWINYRKAPTSEKTHSFPSLSSFPSPPATPASVESAVSSNSPSPAFVSTALINSSDDSPLSLKPSAVQADLTANPNMSAKPNQNSKSLQNLLLIIGGLSVAVGLILVTAFLWERAEYLRNLIIFAVMASLMAGGTYLLHKTRLRDTGSTLVILGFLLSVVTFLWLLPLLIPQLVWYGDSWPSIYPTAILSFLAVGAYWLSRKFSSSAWTANTIIAGVGGILFAYYGLQMYDVEDLTIDSSAIDALVVDDSFTYSATPRWVIISTIFLLVGIYLIKRVILADKTDKVKRKQNTILASFAGASAFVAVPSFVPLSTNQFDFWLMWIVSILTVAAYSVFIFRNFFDNKVVKYIILTTVGALGSWLLLNPTIIEVLPLTVSTFIVGLWGGIILNLSFIKNLKLSMGMRILGAVIAWGVWLINTPAYLNEYSYTSDELTYFTIIFAGTSALSIYLLAWVPQSGRLPAAAWIYAIPAAIATVSALTLIPDYYLESFSVEKWSVPLALILMVSGYTIYKIKPQAKTQETIMPSLGMLLIPTSFSIWSFIFPDNNLDWEKTIVLLALGVILLVAGLRYKLSGVFYPALATLIFVIPAILWTAQEPLPRWVTFTIIGALLILVAAKLEWVKNQYSKWAKTFDELALLPTPANKPYATSHSVSDSSSDSNKISTKSNKLPLKPSYEKNSSESKEKTEPSVSGLAIAGFVFSFVIWPVGLILAIIAHIKIAKGEAKGLGFVIASYIIAGLLLAWFLFTTYALMSFSL